MEEIWKDVVGFEDYFKISNLGRVLGKRSSRILKGSVCSSGYISIHTRFGSRQGPTGRFLVHRAVAEAFLAPPPEYLLKLKTTTFYGIVPVNHKDGDKFNNRIDNLEWCSYSENSSHAVLNGLTSHPKGLDNPLFKLTEEQVKYIVDNYKPRDSKFGSRALGRLFSVDHNAVLKAYKLYS